ncbi:cupin domain-containing protein [uncultured Algibacter sp.]|uniref:cupin domain-containing protein n=1 Tax=uncultured Algibacter sp. TaxID=298659 RepID=UPI00262349AE|nr:cupin domain-containing protein [uncultured Algibacter sp.]
MKNLLQIKTSIVLLLCFSFLVCNNLNAQEKEYTIDDCVNTFNKEEAIPTKVGYQYWFADKDFLDGRTIKMSVVAPGKATHAPHKHPEDEFFYVLEGKAKFHLDGNEVVVQANTSLYCPSNIMHGISNAGETELKYLVIKKYE